MTIKNILLKTLHFFIGFAIKPRVFADELLCDRGGLLPGFSFMLIYCLCLSIISLLYFFTGMKTPLKPFLAVNPGNLYLLQAFSAFPAISAGVLSYSALSAILARIMGGKGNFEKAFPAQVFALLTPSFILTLAPKLFFFRLPWFAEVLSLFILPELWAMLLSIIVLIKAYKMDPLCSAMVFFISSLPSLVINAIFIR